MTEASMTERDKVMGLLEQPPGKRPAFFSESGLDQVFSMVVELAAEVWVLRERLYAVEDVSRPSGASLRDRVDAWEPTPAQSTELAEMREMMMRQLFRTVSAKTIADGGGSPFDDPMPPQA